MGLFDFITNLFGESDKRKPKKKKAAKKKAASKAGKKKSAPKSGKKKKTAGKAGTDIGFSLNAQKTKKRKKAKQVKAAPINEDALGFSISLKDEDEQAKKRNAVRIRVDGLEAHVLRLKKKFPVTDISATGLGFAFEKPRIKGGVKLDMDLYLDGKLKIEGITCKVMRHERGSVGCVFQDLDRSQDDTVHEVVLLGQKQQAARKSAKKDRNFSLPD